MMKHALLIIFAKAPVAGQVNTRLIPHIGEAAATQLQQQLIETRMQQFQPNPHYDIELCCAPHSDHEVFQNCQRQHGIRLSVQQGSDLGQRMSAAFAQALQRYRKVVLIGTDAPVVGDDEVRAALAYLQSHDVVLQPAQDGGYVLIAMRREYPQVFNAIDWGSAQVFEQTCNRLAAAGVAWKQLPTAWDIDTAEDYQHYLQWAGSH